MSGLGNQGGGPQKQLDPAVSKATSNGSNANGTVNAGNSATSGGKMGLPKKERPQNFERSGGLGN